ncbi:hypothetical protein Fmac_003807 [Flemingia macrophylla]|uniref:Ovate family protein n=1 Tax=Flemingia macrophylla TaxID=520843 RepID=A0ABD1N346_9FABA
MVLSNTKKFLQRSLENFKSCFSPGYEKLPKTPPHSQFSCSVATASFLNMDNNDNNPCYKELVKFYSDFKQWDSEKEKGIGRRRSKKKGKGEAYNNDESFIGLNNINASHEHKKNEMAKGEECHEKKKNRNEKGKQQKDSSSMGMVEKKLREMEMLEMSDVDYVLDIQEFLHYYSRLTCPLYLQIVDKFFMQVYSEFFPHAPLVA